MGRRGLPCRSVLLPWNVIPQWPSDPGCVRPELCLERRRDPARYHLEALERISVAQPDRAGRRPPTTSATTTTGRRSSRSGWHHCSSPCRDSRHPDRKLIRGWLLLVGLAVWFACGRTLAFYTVLYHLVPGMSWFRVPARSLFLANLGAVLVGLGIETLSIRSPAPARGTV